MARRTKKTAAVEAAVPSNLVDVSKLNYYELMDLANKARSRDYEKELKEEEERKKNHLTSKEHKALKDKVKTLRKKFEGLPSELVVKLNVPVELRLNFDSDSFDHHLSEAMSGYGDFESVFRDWYLDLKLVGNGGLDRIQKPLVEEALRNYSESDLNQHCEQVFQLFPDHRKSFRDFVDELSELAQDIENEMDEYGLEFEDIVESE